MRVDGNAAAVVAHGQDVVGLQLDLDARCLARHRFVHRVVENFGGEMMERVLVGAADIHAGPAPDRLEAFEDLDVFRRVSGPTLWRCVEEIGRFGHLQSLAIRQRHVNELPPRFPPPLDARAGEESVQISKF
jgi:hypothetical protein